MQTSHQTTALHEPLFLYDSTLHSVAPTLGGAYNIGLPHPVAGTGRQVQERGRRR